MPIKTTERLKIFLSIIFEGAKGQENKDIVKINQKEYVMISSSVFGSSYRTLKDYEKLMISFNILKENNGSFVVFDKKAYDKYLLLQVKIKKLENGF